MTQGSLSYQFKTADIITKLIVINVLIFLVVIIATALFQLEDNFLTQWFVLPESFSHFITQPWSIVTYNFIHTGFWHILFNMLWLYFFGRYVTNLFSERRFLAIYLLGGIAGGVLYMISYNIFPAFVSTVGTLQGASAAVMALMGFSATYSPNAPIRIFTINLKLWHIAMFFILWNLVSLSTLKNAGGILAHLGGAFFGYVYARQLLKGNDIGNWFERLLERIVALFTPKKKKPFKKVHRNKTTQNASQRFNKETKTDYQKQVDQILDKIGKSGYESLTKEEKDFLFKAGKEN
ncbi:MAG: rhomboid family intramembrane serine protease [Flavobacteriaceae bacterium]|nr:rhomboid family intramembrane serine protease [Flavobacteriaceae bacterium]